MMTISNRGLVAMTLIVLHFLAGASRGHCDSASIPLCVQSLSDWCEDQTAKPRGECFMFAAGGCAGSARGYSDCVVETSNLCVDDTTRSKFDCLNEGAMTCKQMQAGVQR
jgi:hypothetical protein